MAAAADHRMSEQLVERFEREALPHRAALVQNALRLTRHGQDAEDLVQETMLHACAGFYWYRSGPNARAGCLLRIMVNAFISGYRKGQHEPHLVLASEQQLLSSHLLDRCRRLQLPRGGGTDGEASGRGDVSLHRGRTTLRAQLMAVLAH